MTHAEFQELGPIYALGALEGAELDAFTRHLAECAECPRLVLEFQEASTSLALSLPVESPSAAVKERLLASVRPAKASPFAPLVWAAAAALLVAALLGPLWMQADRRLREAEERLAKTERELAFYRTAQVAYMKGHEKLAPGAVAVARWKDNRVVFDAKGLPALPPKKVYELWAIVPGKDPIPAGAYVFDSSGALRRRLSDGRLAEPEFTFDQNLAKPVFAVTLEEGEVTKPTLDLMFLVPDAK